MTFFLPAQRWQLRVIPFLLLLFLASREAVAAPISVSISASGKLTCANQMVTLTAVTTATGLTTYKWSGPNGYSATGDTVEVVTAGAYRVIATNPAGTGIATVTVGTNTTAPAGLTAGNSGALTCLNPGVTLFANSTSPGVSYSWTGPNGYTASSFLAMTSAPGTYLVTAVDSGSGCASTALTTVAIDTASPVVAISSDPINNTITCSHPQVVFTSVSNSQGVTYAWAGPNNFTEAGAVATVTTSGNYSLTATNPGNGCSSLNWLNVGENTAVPGGGSVTDVNEISCNSPSTEMRAQSLTPGTTFAWTGPGGFSDTGAVINVSAGGIYTTIFTNPANGCIFTSSITVREDTARPAGVTATHSDELTCDVTTVTLTGNSTTPGVNYFWTGPNGFFDPEQISTSATDSGTYRLLVSNPNNGCATLASTIVTQDLTACSAIKSTLTTGYAAAFNDSVAGFSGFICKVNPNPITTTAFVEFESSTASQVSVGIYNNAGVLERILFSNAVEANHSYRLMLDPAGLAAGIHYCLIRVDGKVYTRKLLFLPL